MSEFINPPKHTLSTEHKPHLENFDAYSAMYKESVEDPQKFWKKYGSELLTWFRPFQTVMSGELSKGNIAWFSDGELNVCFNCVDRHARNYPNKVAIIGVGDELGDSKRITYSELLDQVCRLANVLKHYGIQKGDTVAIYMPMIPEAAVAMLASARIGAVHTVVFAGFSSEALRDRINDAGCKILLTADQGKRGGKIIQLKSIADDALLQCPTVKHVIVYKHTSDVNVPFRGPRDLDWNEKCAERRPFCPPVPMNAEDPLFLLYTSGSTGKPKGLMHTQAGYLLGATMTLKYTFDVHDNDIFACMADVGWITGHSYSVYGPLSNGFTTLFFESVPTYPTAARYWQTIEEFKITHFYTAPTAIRALKRLGDEFASKHKMDSLRVLGTVGEPINPEAWNWYNKVIGKEKCAIVDTYWQTETGSFIAAPYATITPTKPGSCTLPQFGISLEILKAEDGTVLHEKEATGVLCISKPWPSMARTILNDHKRYLEAYFQPYPGYYFSGDGARRDKDGYFWIQGRVDDVINVSGHRLSTAEIESALVLHPRCAEAAVIGAPDDITGQSIVAFCSLKPGNKDIVMAIAELTQQVRRIIGPFATPKRIFVTADLPKTRSGKIMRRILRKIVCGESDQLGDLSTLADPSVIPALIQLVKAS